MRLVNRKTERVGRVGKGVAYGTKEEDVSGLPFNRPDAKNREGQLR
jgi:hypothetical protein